MYQLFSYACVGASAAIVDFSVFFLLLPYLHNNYIIASFVSFIIAVSCNFILCNLFLFERNNISLKQAYFRHVFSNSLSFLFGLGLLSFLIYRYELTSFLIPKIAVSGVLICFNYASARWFSFNNSW